MCDADPFMCGEGTFMSDAGTFMCGATPFMGDTTLFMCDSERLMSDPVPIIHRRMKNKKLSSIWTVAILKKFIIATFHNLFCHLKLHILPILAPSQMKFPLDFPFYTFWKPIFYINHN